MITNEYLSWIMDDKKDTRSYEEDVPDKSISSTEWADRNWEKHEATVKKNVEFVHSLGLKCDSVGWCSLDLNRPDINTLLEQIYSFVLKEGLYLRGNYARRYSDIDSEWYLLESKYLSNDEWNYVNVPDKSGNSIKIHELYAYKIPKYIPTLWSNNLPHVDEDIRNCCLKYGFSGIDFYWIRDIGRYDAKQFFGLIIENIVPEFACNRYLSYSDSKNKRYLYNDHSVGSPLYQKYLALGGTLPKLSQLFYDLSISLPIQLPRNKMPESDFAYINFKSCDCSEQYALIKKHVADKLISDKVIRKEFLMPVILYDKEPAGHHIQTTEALQYPSEEVIKSLEIDYNKLRKNPKPERKASEKDALKLFRNVKRLRPDDFNKSLNKKKLETLVATSYELLSSYYSISDGGCLSDEYSFLSYSESLHETLVYSDEIEKEELLMDKHIGIVVAKCADGDTVILCTDASVKRISHETMDVCENWDTIAQFFFDSLEDILF